VTTVDFWRLAEEVSGQDLAWFFEQWLMQGGIPRYTLYWTTSTAGVDVLLCADQSAPYRLDLPLRFKVTDLTSSDVSLEVSGSETRASFPLSYLPGEVSADPDQAVLAQVQVQPIAELPAVCPAASTP
jgi:aminopeptidase N